MITIATTARGMTLSGNPKSASPHPRFLVTTATTPQANPNTGITTRGMDTSHFIASDVVPEGPVVNR